jgi:glycosyltransferase involved in cell wall biosynthesis
LTERRRIAVYYNVGWGGGRRWLYECVSRLGQYHDLDLYCIDRDSIGVQYPDVSGLGHETRMTTFADLKLPGRALKPLALPLKLADLVRFDGASKRVAAQIDARGYDLLFASVGGYTEAPMVLRHAATPSAYYCHEPMRILYEPRVPRPYERGLVAGAARKLWRELYYGGLMRRWDRQGTRRSRLVIANSRYTAGYARRVYGVAPLVNYPGVDTQAFAPAEGTPRERFVLSVGEFISSKGFDDAVRAIGAIGAERRPPLVVVSNRTHPPELAYVCGIARACGVELDVRERVEDAELRRLYRTAMVLLYTPNREPFGLAAIEAMASGTPVVAVADAGPGETVVDGETGFLRARDPAELGAAVARLLDDEVLRARMSRAARAHAVRAFTWDRSVEELAEMLSDMAESTHTSKDGSRAGDPLDMTHAARARR